ncbi:MAG: NADH dehydrogenase subunit L [Chlorobi bacterium OLB5]|nr:MAG: NADH dehydrogenase subunit L [Chlorobi bacterium OLB5]
MIKIIYLISLFPLTGFLFYRLFGNKVKVEIITGVFSSSMLLASLVITVIAYLHLISLPQNSRYIIFPLFEWVKTETFCVSASYLVNMYSVMVCFIITIAGLTIHLYSLKYMKIDKKLTCFLCNISLVVFLLLNAVLFFWAQELVSQ